MVDLRVLEPTDSDYHVNPKKLFIFLLEDRIITLHNGNLNCLNQVRQRFSEGHYKNRDNEGFDIGPGYIFARIAELVHRQNDNTIRILEDSIKDLDDKMFYAKPRELKDLARDVNEIQETVNYVEIKNVDNLENLQNLVKRIKSENLEIIMGALSAETVHLRLARMTANFGDLLQRSRWLLTRSNEIDSSHSQYVSMHNDKMNTNMTVLGWMLAPVLTAAAYVDILSDLEKNPKLYGWLGAGAAVSLYMYIKNKIKKIF